MKSGNKFGQLLVINLLVLLSSHCGRTGGGTTGGNPITSSQGKITIQSTAYSNQATARSADLGLSASVVSDFKFCITKVKLKNSEGSAVSSNGVESIEATLGLIDLSTASASKTWGEIQIPVGFQLGEMTFELHKDPEKCSAAVYSLSYQGTQLTKDLEFSFKPSSTVSLSAGDLLRLDLSLIATAIERAYAAGKLTNESVAEYLNSTVSGKVAKP